MNKKSTFVKWRRYLPLYLMLIPGVVYIFINNYIPMAGLIMAFEKYDYKNKDADWKDSKDAIQRGMQKLRGSDPSLPPHVLKK